MPTPKKSAKKGAKKTAGHHHDNELRRAYEHMGRLEVLRTSLKSAAADLVAELVKLAQQEIEDGHSKDAADLLRAAEHLSFAALAGESSSAGRISVELEESITERFDELMRRAEEHWGEEPHSTALTGLHQTCRDSAAKTFRAHAYYRALEFARAAEALAHVKQHGPLKLESGRKKLQLKSA